jgi:ribosome maturation factor RimP
METMAQEADIEARVEGLLADPVHGLGFQLLEVQFRFESRWVLRLVIDREGGVGLDDCGAVSELAGRILDVEDPIPNAFALEVSSPGVFRPLRTPAHFRQSVGKIARLILAPDALTEVGGRVLRGRIAEVKEETLIIELNEETREVPLSGISRARLDPDL